MTSMRGWRATLFLPIVLQLQMQLCKPSYGQAALLMEGAAGISSVVNPTGHEAVYFARICAASPVKLRRCRPGELGSAIARYKGIGGYDWAAVPLIPYLYSVENPAAVPERVDHETVQSLRVQYHDAHLPGLGKDVPEGGRIKRGWNQLVGASYERAIYVFRFRTTEAQDDALIAKMNAEANRSHFSIFFRNCANFSAGVLNVYFPHRFGRRRLPDAGIVTPRQITYELVRYARSHPEMQLTVAKIAQIPGYRRPSRTNESVAESLVVTGYVIPLAAVSPFVAAGVAADCLLWGRYPIKLKGARMLTPENVGWLASGAISAR